MKNKRISTLAIHICVAIILVTVMLVTAVACGPKAPAPTTTAPAVTTPAATTPAATTPAATTPAATKPAPTPSAQVYKWKFQAITGNTDAIYKAEEWWIKWIEQATGGRLQMTLYPAGQIVNTVDIIPAFRDNLVQIGDTAGQYYMGFIPEGGIEFLWPGLLKNPQELDHLWYELGMVDLLRQAYAPHGVLYYAPFACSSWHMWGTKQIKTLDDFKGKKIRLGTGTLAEMMEKLGASTVFLPPTECYMALKLGTIDIFCSGLGWYDSTKMYEVSPYMMRPAVLPFGANGSCISQKAFDALPADLQAILLSHGPTRNWAESSWTKLYDFYCLAQVEKNNNQFVDMDPSVVKTLQEMGVSYLDPQAKKSALCAKMVDLIKQEMKLRGYLQ